MKPARHALIIELISNYSVETQYDLAKLLREHGIHVTQATVSRDINELRLVKVLMDNGRYKYATSDVTKTGLQDRFMKIFSHSVTSLTSAGNLIIVKTITGTAAASAEAIDSLEWDEVAGTVAGDNTVFVAIKDDGLVEEVLSRIKELMC